MYCRSVSFKKRNSIQLPVVETRWRSSGDEQLGLELEGEMGLERIGWWVGLGFSFEIGRGW